MQRVNLNLDHYHFYCPVTGEKVLDPEFQASSSAMLFSYLETNDSLEHARDEFETLYENILEHIQKDSGLVDSYEKAFEKLLSNELLSDSNYILFTIEYYNSGSGGHILHLAFDMNYTEEDEEEEEEEDETEDNEE
jgi:hypothetical protein